MLGIRLFMQGLLQMAWYWQVWVFCLILVNFVAPFFFWGDYEAKIIFSAMALNGMLMMGLCHVFGFVRLLGLGHIFWIPLVIFLSLRIGVLEGSLLNWVLVVIIINCLSLLIDTIDVIRYFRGEREPLGEFK